MALLTQGTKDTFVRALDQFMIRSDVTKLIPKQQKPIYDAITNKPLYTWFKTDDKGKVGPNLLVEYNSGFLDELVKFVQNNTTLTKKQIKTPSSEFVNLITTANKIFDLVTTDLSTANFDDQFKNLTHALTPVFKDGTIIRKFIDYVSGVFGSYKNDYIKSSILFLLAEIMKEAITLGFIQNPKTTPAVQAQPAVQASTHVGKIRPGKFIPLQEREYISPHYYRERNGKPYNRVRFSPTVRNRQNLRLIV
jgi:hypothetical protein